jgi:hypothetical protein
MKMVRRPGSRRRQAGRRRVVEGSPARTAHQAGGRSPSVISGQVVGLRLLERALGDQSGLA